MKILSLETATYFGGTAFVTPESTERAGPFSPRGASREVLSSIHRMLANHNCRIRDLDLVVASTGPGLFTGVRTGLSIAKTLCHVGSDDSGRPALVGAPTLEAVASLVLEHPDAEVRAGDWTLAVTDARRGEVYAALFRLQESAEDQPDLLRLCAEGEDMVVRPSKVAERLLPKEMDAGASEVPARIHVIGDATERYRDILHEQFGERARLLSPAGCNLPVALARLGEARFRAGRVDDPLRLRPHYVRRPDARPPVIEGLSA